MTTLYRSVLIETAEQAERLPEGTVATHGGSDGYAYEVAIRDDEGLWWSAPGGLRQDEPAYTSKTIVGFAALVPIEAEEEFTAMGSDDGEPWIAHVGRDGIDGSREEAQQYVDRFGGFIAHRARTPWEEAQ